MKELKFTCPSCGQHVQCDANHAGENVPCPGCAALIRVPLHGAVTEIPSPVTDASLLPAATEDSKKVSYAVMKPDEELQEKDPPPPPASRISNENPASPPAPTPTLPVKSDEKPASVTAADALELYCVCPVCQSELRIPLAAESPSDGLPHITRLARVNESRLEKKPAAPQTDTKQLSLTERERQIAAAREAHPPSAYPAFKPRLDQILGGDAVEDAA